MDGELKMKKISMMVTAAAFVLSSAGVTLAGGPVIVAAESEPVAQPEPKAYAGGLGIGGLVLAGLAIGAIAIVASDGGNGSSTTTTTD